ncbi:MAG: hypothetical protein MUE79_03065 [Nitratireductor sp.]|jgi:hypothetical protein|nr:hypothetical protein [Nitratireductor sp.]
MVRILSVLVIFTALAAGPGLAAQSGSSSGGAGFSCPPDDETCTCDGTYTDCTNMKVNCVDGTMQCKRVDGLERCWCQRKASAIRKLPRPGKLSPAIRQVK